MDLRAHKFMLLHALPPSAGSPAGILIASHNMLPNSLFEAEKIASHDVRSLLCLRKDCVFHEI